MNTLKELRAMAEAMLEKHPNNRAKLEDWSGNFKALLDELNVYQIELEHQNAALERSEHELAAAKDEYTKLFESTPVGYVILNENRNIVMANQTFIAYFVSATHYSINGISFDDFIVDEFKNAFVLFCKLALKQKNPIPIELKLQDRNKKSHFVLLTAKTYDPEKRLIALTASDISMQKRMEAQLAHARDAAEDADKKKSRFLTNVSHEIRTLLSTIIGYGALMDDPNVSAVDKNDFFKNVVATNKVLMRLSDDVISVSSLESGETPLHNQVVDIEKICTETSHIVASKVRNKKITVSAGHIPMLWTDMLRINQIVFSILDYAANNAKSDEIKLACFYEHEKDKHGKLIFNFSGDEIFTSERDSYRDNAQNSMQTDSCGMASLFLVKRIITAMKGVMKWLHPLNELSIEIPVEISPYSESPAQTAPLLPAETDKTQPKNCLLVDDVVMNLKILGMIMSKFGYTPTLAISGEDAIKLVKEKHFDLIMTDLWMPNMSGEELAMLLRQDSKFENMPIYAVTADVESNSNFNMDFFDGIIIKPVNTVKIKQLLGVKML